LFISGDRHYESWQEPSHQVDFYYLKTVVSKILLKLGITDLVPEKADAGIFSQGVTLTRNSKKIVSFGLIQNKFNKLMDLKQAVYYAEFDMDALLKQYNNSLEYQEISKFPEVRRDLSLVLDKKVTFEEIKKLALQTERKLLREINVFDVYEGENLGGGKKSYSVSFILQDYEQTLTDKVIDKTMERLMQTFEKELGAIIRK
jgi:phenylalanyl-tRNA synthetase beta chain